MFSNTTRIEIQFGDCDPAGIVYYPNYFRFFDNATAALLSEMTWHRASHRSLGLLNLLLVLQERGVRGERRGASRVCLQSKLTSSWSDCPFLPSA